MAKEVIAEQTSSKAINTKIASVRSTGKAWNARVQETALMIIAHSEKYGDCSAAARLGDALPPRLRTLLQRWFQMHSPIAIYRDPKSKQKRLKASLRKQESNAYNRYNLAAAKLVQWNEIPEAQKEVDFKTFDDFQTNMDKMLERWNNMLQATADNAKDKTCVKTAGDVRKIKAKIAAVKAALKADA